MKGKPSIADKLEAKMNHDKCVGINVTIPQRLLSKVENDIDGKNRSRKLVYCIKAGYAKIMGGDNI